MTKQSIGECATLINENCSPTEVDVVPYVGLEHIGEGSLQLTGVGRSSDVTSAKSRFRKGDVLFGKLRPYFRKVVKAPFDGICSTDIWVIRPTDLVDSGFLFYVAASTDFIDHAMRGAGGTRMPRAQWDHVTRFELELPPLPEQRRIAGVLGALDDKIELNRRMNQTLEEMARAIFKDWFVDFGPVRAKIAGQQPYLPDDIWSLFPDRLVDSQLGQIPEGWEFKRLGEICEKPQYGYTQSATDEPVGPKFLRITDINKQAWIDWDAVPHCEIDDADLQKYQLSKGDVLIARIADPGHGCLIEEDLPAVFASYLIRFKPIDERYRRYIQYWLRSGSYWRLVEGRAAGTTRVSLNAKVLGAFPILLPPWSILAYLSVRLDSIRNRVIANADETRSLAAQRDALLPKLVSGEVRV